MKENKFSFTDVKIKNLPLKSKRYSVIDSKIPHLELLVYPKGKKTFCFYFRLKNIPQHQKIGNFPDITVEVAREAAIKFQNEINLTQTPLKNKKWERALMSVVFDEFIEFKQKLAPKTKETYIDMWKRLLEPEIGGYKVCQIDNELLVKLHRKLSIHPYQANRCIMLLKTMFNFLIRQKSYIGSNPALAVELNEEKNACRVLTEQEMSSMFYLLNQMERTTSLYIFLSMIIPERKDAMLSMRWKDIDFKNRTWIVPHSKTQDNFPRHLPDIAISVLKNLYETRINDYVFPSHKSKTGHLVNPKKTFKKVLKQAGITDRVRIHDLRHTIATYYARDGVGREQLKVLLGHKSYHSADVYINLNQKMIQSTIDDGVNSMMNGVSVSFDTNDKNIIATAVKKEQRYSRKSTKTNQKSTIITEFDSDEIAELWEKKQQTNNALELLRKK